MYTALYFLHPENQNSKPEQTKEFDRLEDAIRWVSPIMHADKTEDLGANIIGSVAVITAPIEAPGMTWIMSHDGPGSLKCTAVQKPPALTKCGWVTVPGIPMPYPVPAGTPGISMNGCFIANDPDRLSQECCLPPNHAGKHDMVDIPRKPPRKLKPARELTAQEFYCEHDRVNCSNPLQCDNCKLLSDDGKEWYSEPEYEEEDPPDPDDYSIVSAKPKCKRLSLKCCCDDHCSCKEVQ